MQTVTDLPTLGYFWAAILGIVQGVTEFLPISSSGHLALVEHFGIGMAVSPAFDIFLHLATLLVVVVYFRKSIYWYYRNDLRVLLYVIAATIPTGIIGLAFKMCFEMLRFSPTMICIGLLVTASALSVAEIRRGSSCRLRDLGWSGAFIIGLCQALALAPGISRSGFTIAGCMICGVERDEAFRFSFFLSIPAVGGAVFLTFLQAMRNGGWEGVMGGVPMGAAWVGFAMAVVSGFVALAILERLVVGGRLVWFAGYCCVVALAGLIYFNLIA